MGITKSKPDQKSLSYKIRNELRNDILSGRIEPGSRLNQEALAARFDASRIPVREALRQLEMEGLVQTRLNRGAIVSAPSIEDICDLLDIRIALECHAAKLAVPKMKEEHIHYLKTILEQYHSASKPNEWAENNRLFHLGLCEPAENKQLTALIKLYCMSTSSPYANFHLDMTNATDIDTVNSDHMKIFEACKNRDVSQVITVLEQHILSTKKSLMNYQNITKSNL